MKLILDIQIILSILILVFVVIAVQQQVYALKEYVNDEYNIKFQYPDEWHIIDREEEVMEIGSDITIILIALRTEQKEGEYIIEEPAIFIQVYPDIVYPDINDLKQLSKHVQRELLKDNLYDIIDYKKKDNGDTQYINITYQTTPKIDYGKLIATDYLFYNENTGYRISYSASPDLVTANKNNQKIMNEIFENITQSVNNINNGDNYLKKNYTKIIEQKFKGDNCPYSFCDLLVNVVFEGNNTIFLEGCTKTLTKDTQELTFSDIFFQSIELLQEDKFNIRDFENTGDGTYQVLLSK